MFISLRSGTCHRIATVAMRVEGFWYANLQTYHATGAGFAYRWFSKRLPRRRPARVPLAASGPAG
jgi:hypothetical protein